MLIRLEHNNRIVHEVASADMSGEIVIGRSSGCAWPVPKEDTVTSSRHAALARKGRAVWIKDLQSTNGTFHKGKRIEKLKLAIGDRVSVGNCVVCVEPDRGGEGRPVSELAVLAGKGRGQKKPLNPPLFTIGSDPSSSLVFLDMLVSRKHAEISIKEDGSCWIRDLGSKNGTSVNGLALRDDKERLLKDGDRLAIAHLEMEFHDGAVQRSNKQTWLRIGILGATLVLALSLYGAYQQVRPSAESFIGKARRLAAAERFAESREAVEKAVNARHAASNQIAIEDLRRLIGLWETTLSTWAHAQKALLDGKWVQASRDLGVLQAAKKEAWEWNDKGAIEKERAERVKAMLDAYLRAESSIVREDIGFGELSADAEAVRKALAAVADDLPKYAVRLKEGLEGLERRQRKLIEEGRGLEAALDQLKSDMPPYAEVVKAVEEAALSKEGSLRRRATVLLEPMRALGASFARLNEAADLARSMQFAKAIALDLKLPSVDAAALDPRLSQARLTLDRAQRNLKVKCGQFAFLYQEVEKRLGGNLDEPEILKALKNPQALLNALACDSMELPLPKRSRTAPAGDYDRLLGVEEFYQHLAAMPGPVDSVLVADLPFTSGLTLFREAVVKIEALKAFARQPENEWLVGGKIQIQIEKLDAVLDAREALVQAMATKAEAASGREALLAGGMVARLVTGPEPVKITGLPAGEWVAEALRKQRAPLLRLNDEYSMAAPSRQIQIRGEILRQGVPGDPVVRRMWAMRDAAQTR
jgi:pSer/pThr/pTyr-binding forkhead associated (FHA) protein